MILEHAPFGHRGLYSSFTLQGVQAGQILAAAVFLPLARYLPPEMFIAWGWRVPFLFSAFAVAAGYVIRRRVPETPVLPSSTRADRPNGHLWSRPSPIDGPISCALSAWP